MQLHMARTAQKLHVQWIVVEGVFIIMMTTDVVYGPAHLTRFGIRVESFGATVSSSGGDGITLPTGVMGTRFCLHRRT
jgi:hypothetical protein